MLILDEPTNHLDIASREWMEGLLENYEGTMIFVSHDRYFIDRFATSIWRMNEGRISCFRGTYAEYRRSLEATSSEKSEPRPSNVDRERPPERESLSRRLRRAEKNLAVTEREISGLEEALANMDAKIEAAATDPNALTALYEEKARLDEQIAALYERWEAEADVLAGLKAGEPQ